jgi:hypothetical protein
MTQCRGRADGGQYAHPLSHVQERAVVGQSAAAQAHCPVARLGDAVECHRVRAQEGRQLRTRRKARRLMHALEEIGHGARIESAGDQGLDADAVGLGFVMAREVDLALHGARLHGGDGGDARIGAAVGAQDDRAQHGGDGRHGHALLVFQRPRQVALRDVRNFVAEHGGQFVLGLGGQDQAAVHADVAARAGERVQRRVRDDEEIEAALRIAAVAAQALADTLQVAVDERVVQHRHALAHLAHEADADALLQLLGQQSPGRIANFGQGDFRLRKRHAQAKQQADQATQHEQAAGSWQGLATKTVCFRRSYATAHLP